jgi:hypothetical protein
MSLKTGIVDPDINLMNKKVCTGGGVPPPPYATNGWCGGGGEDTELLAVVKGPHCPAGRGLATNESYGGGGSWAR